MYIHLYIVNKYIYDDFWKLNIKFAKKNLRSQVVIDFKLSFCGEIFIILRNCGLQLLITELTQKTGGGRTCQGRTRHVLWDRKLKKGVTQDLIDRNPFNRICLEHRLNKVSRLTWNCNVLRKLILVHTDLFISSLKRRFALAF